MALQISKKQEMFVAEYLVDQNATRAYIAAGYSHTGAAQSASRLLRNVKVLAAIESRHGKRLEELDITADRVLAELAKMGFANMLDFLNLDDAGVATIDLSKLSREKGAAIQEVTVEEVVERTGKTDIAKVRRTKFKLSDKLRALEMLGRHLKLFTDKVEVDERSATSALAAVDLDLTRLSDEDLGLLHRILSDESNRKAPAAPALRIVDGAAGVGEVRSTGSESGLKIASTQGGAR